MNYSVIITHYNREENLRNCLIGLNNQEVRPLEVIVVNLGEALCIPIKCESNLRILKYSNGWKYLPVGAARNFGAAHAKGQQLVFLDVDCIPAPDFCASIGKLAAQTRGLVMGTPKYLLFSNVESQSHRYLRSHSVYHPMRPKVTGTIEENRYELFWSLCFAMSAEQFCEIEGFDEVYEGYGCEDTDFALKCKKKGLSFHLCDYEVFHQQHPIFVPPLNHLQSIVNNCNYFHKKWGFWPMDDCLQTFSDLGYIGWNKALQAPIEIRQKPSKNAIMRQLVKNAPYR